MGGLGAPAPAEPRGRLQGPSAAWARTGVVDSIADRGLPHGEHDYPSGHAPRASLVTVALAESPTVGPVEGCESDQGCGEGCHLRGRKSLDTPAFGCTRSKP